MEEFAADIVQERLYPYYVLHQDTFMIKDSDIILVGNGPISKEQTQLINNSPATICRIPRESTIPNYKGGDKTSIFFIRGSHVQICDTCEHYDIPGPTTVVLHDFTDDKDSIDKFYLSKSKNIKHKYYECDVFFHSQSGKPSRDRIVRSTGNWALKYIKEQMMNSKEKRLLIFGFSCGFGDGRIHSPLAEVQHITNEFTVRQLFIYPLPYQFREEILSHQFHNVQNQDKYEEIGDRIDNLRLST